MTLDERPERERLRYEPTYAMDRALRVIFVTCVLVAAVIGWAIYGSR